MTAVAAALPLAAAQPLRMADVMPGLWEIGGVPGAKSPVRECVGDVSQLAQFEHRRQSCRRTLVNDNGSSRLVEYSCGGAGFGRAKMTVITPRSLRIEAQGISGGLPFGYVLQARRVGDCVKSSTSAAH